MGLFAQIHQDKRKLVIVFANPLPITIRSGLESEFEISTF
jgi:hypothetical protein